MPKPTIPHSGFLTGIAPFSPHYLLRRFVYHSCLTLAILGVAQPPHPSLAQPSPAPSVSPAAPASAAPAPAPQPPLNQFIQWAIKHPAIALPLISSASLALLYLIILWRTPLSLLHIIPGKLTIPGSKIELPNGALLWLKYRPRVLDTWVADHLPEVRQKFSQQPTVSDRALHIPIQIKLDSKLKDPFTASGCTGIGNLWQFNLFGNGENSRASGLLAD